MNITGADIIFSQTAAEKTVADTLISLVFPGCLPLAIQFIMLKTQAPTASFTIPLVLFCIIYSCIYVSPANPLFEVQLGAYVFFAFRLLDIGLLPRNMTQWWSFVDYLEFTYCFDTKATRAERVESLKKKAASRPDDVNIKRQLTRIIPYKQLTLAYYK
jgi:hypothetical protein